MWKSIRCTGGDIYFKGETGIILLMYNTGHRMLIMNIGAGSYYSLPEVQFFVFLFKKCSFA